MKSRMLKEAEMTLTIVCTYSKALELPPLLPPCLYVDEYITKPKISLPSVLTIIQKGLERLEAKQKKQYHEDHIGDVIKGSLYHGRLSML